MVVSRPQVFIGREEVARVVSRLAAEISKDYDGRQVLLLGVLKGCFVFMADLVRQIRGVSTEMEFVTLSSYEGAMVSSGRVHAVRGIRADIREKEVLVIEDIVDTGTTISYLLNYLKSQGPASVRLCALLDKPSRRQIPVEIDYLGCTVPDKFIVGYGLDAGEKFRHLPDICIWEGRE